jgi:hypothetical protein
MLYMITPDRCPGSNSDDMVQVTSTGFLVNRFLSVDLAQLSDFKPGGAPGSPEDQ